MHISDGILSGPVLAAGTLLAAGGIGIGLKKTEDRMIPRGAVFTSVFFVASLVHLPLGPAGVHLVLNGLAGIMLGWAVFPALFLGLLLQSILFSHGGITALGVNTFNMAFPGLVCFKIFRLMKNKPAGGFIAGFSGVAGSLILLSTSLILTEKTFIPVSKLLSAGHLPVAVIEGIITASAVKFILMTAPGIITDNHAS